MSTDTFERMKEAVTKVHYQPCRGEMLSRYQLHLMRGDYWIVEFNRKFYVAVPAYQNAHGGRIPKACIESWACGSLTEAVDRLDAMEQDKAKACERYQNND